MSKPVKPVVPPPALRSEPDTFKDRAEANIEFFEPLVDYMDDVADFVDEQADAAVAAAQAGDLPPISSKALQLLRVNAGGTGLDFQRVMSSLTDTTTGNLMVVGAFGLGLLAGTVIPSADEKSLANGFHVTGAGTVGLPSGVGSLYGTLLVEHIDNNNQTQRWHQYTTNTIYIRAWTGGSGGAWSSWDKLFSIKDLATQLEAEACADNTRLMTPLRTKQAIAKFASGAPQAVLEEHTDDGVQGTTVTANVWGTLDLNTATRNLNAVLTFDGVAHTFTPTRNGWTEWSYINRDIHQTRLYCVTDGVSVGLGVSVNSAAGGQAVSNGGAPVVAGKTYRLEVNKSSTTRSYAASRGDGEVYSRLHYWAD